MFKFSQLMLSLALIGAVAWPALALEPAAPASFQLAAGQRVTDNNNGFSITPPSGWSKGDAGEQTIMVYFDEGEGVSKANFNVNVTMDDGTPVEDLPGFIKPEFKKQFEGWQAVDEGFVTIGGAKSYYLSSRFNMKDLDLQNIQFYIPGKNKRFYVLTFTTLASSFENYADIFEETAMSVQTLE